MYRLTLLGGVSLAARDGPIEGPASQQRRLALLALVGSVGDRGRSRDQLISLLWPETDPRQARQHLSHSIYSLRKALGEEVVRTVGEYVRLSPLHVEVDSLDFENALEAGDYEAASRHYVGPFMDGFFIDDTPEFERWIDSERRRLASLHVRLLEELARKAEERDDLAAAAGWWARLVTHDPYNSAAVVLLMEALAAAGDPANAIQYANQHIRLLDEQFDMGPPDEVVAKIEQLRVAKRPWRRSRPPVEPDFEPTIGKRNRLAPSLLLAGVAAVAALAVFWFARSAPAPDMGTVSSAVMVLPLDNVTGDPGLESWAAYAASHVAGAIAGIGEFRVFDAEDRAEIRETLRKLDTLEGTVLAAELARRSGADHLLEGSILGRSDSVSLEYRLLSSPSREVITAYGATVSRTDADLERAIHVMADSLRVATATWFGLAPEYLESYGRGTSYAAWKEVQTARRLYKERGRRDEAFRHLQRAVEIDSTYDAALGLAMIWNINIGELAKADSIYRILDERAELTSDRQRWQLSVAEAVLRRDRAALQNAFREWRERWPIKSSYWHEAHGAMVAGRPGDCIAALENIAVDDVGEGHLTQYALCFHALGQYDAALERAQQCLLRDPDSQKCRYESARAAAALGRAHEAIDFAGSIVESPVGSTEEDNLTAEYQFAFLVDLGLELLAHGHADASEQVLGEAVEWYRGRVTEAPEPVYRWRLARVLYAAGRWEEANAQFTDISPGELMADSLLRSHNIDVSLLGYRATLAVRLGDEETAQRLDRELAEFDRPLLWGHATYWRATIAAVRGDRERAVEHLREALRLGLFAEQWGAEYPKWDYHVDPDFADLRDYEPFQELVASRG